ncbi:MAG: TIGR03936 family radical SAM-associated protein [Clostridiales bacterium]|nr:TIGR03936 family radical SAM-associated protein [Clostridiales bacterium]
MRIIRIKFKKDSTVRFISHLDMMKAFQRAVRRAGLDAEYSHGFNPQMQMVFGAPLSLGFTSEAEYADFSFTRDYEPDEVKSKLNGALPAGLYAIDSGIRTIKTNIMADIKYAVYDFTLFSKLPHENIVDKILTAESLLVEKTRKGKTKTIDIRQLIVKIEAKTDRLKILVKAGNQNNLNPRLLVEAIRKNIDKSVEGISYNRNEQYVEREGKMVLPLDVIALESK